MNLLRQQIGDDSEPKSIPRKWQRQLLIGTVSFLLLTGTLVVSLRYTLERGRETIRNTETSLRFGAIGDFEYGERNDVGNKLTRLAKTELEKVIVYYNEELHPVFVVEMGDMVESSGVKREKAKKQFRDIDAVFKTVEARTEYVFGNHDLRSLSKEEVHEALGLADNHRSFDEGAWRFVIMDTNFDKSRDGAPMGPNHYVFGFVPESEFVWLETVLDTDRPTIVFLHHPPIPGEKNLLNYREVRDFLARYPNVILTVSGHDPSFKFFEEDNFASLVVDNLANKDSIGSFAALDARYNSLTKEAEIVIEHFGPTRRSLEIKKTLPGDKPRWVNFMERFNLIR